jgi:hypothetical protein
MCAVAALLSCTRPIEDRYGRDLVIASPAAEHAVHRERLDWAMRKLGRLRDERLPKALDPELDRRRRIEAVVEIATAMAESAQRIDFAGPAESPEREDFAARAIRLRDLSLDLAERSETLTPEQLRAQILAIDETCSGCHATFRPQSPR